MHQVRNTPWREKYKCGRQLKMENEQNIQSDTKKAKNVRRKCVSKIAKYI